MDQGLGNALLLRLRAARAIDVGAGAIVIAIEKEHPGPEVDRLLELTGEIVIEAGDQQILDPGVVIGAAVGIGAPRA